MSSNQLNRIHSNRSTLTQGCNVSLSPQRTELNKVPALEMGALAPKNRESRKIKEVKAPELERVAATSAPEVEGVNDFLL